MTQVIQPPLHLRFGALWLLAFPKGKIIFEGKKFQTIDEIQETVMGQLMAIGRTVGSPKVATLKRTETPLSYVQSCIFFNKCLYFLYFLAGYILNRPHKL